jgi:hypothetical protein
MLAVASIGRMTLDHAIAAPPVAARSGTLSATKLSGLRIFMKAFQKNNLTIGTQLLVRGR